MTNLEFYRDAIIAGNEGNCLGGLFYTLKNEVPICGRECRKCLEVGIDWLLKEHCENIKLTQWEYDLLVLKSKNYSPLSPFDSYPVLDEMKRKGYFQGIPNVKLTITNILNNCEVVEDE